MSEQNPFLVPATKAAGGFTVEGRGVAAGRPVDWLKAGWGDFMRNPGVWIGMTVVLLVIVTVLNFIPLIGQLAVQLLMPIFSAGLLLGCKAQREGGELRFDTLFAGFKHNTGKLVMVSIYYLVGVVILMAVTFLVGGGAALTGAAMGDGAGVATAAGGFLLAMLVMLALMVPLVMAIWFAPALVVFRDLEPVPAMKASFAACLKNVLPFLVWSVVVLVLAFVASIPLFIGWLVLVPVLVGGHYSSYLDIFE
jgi:uncharacterized membrane protein